MDKAANRRSERIAVQFFIKKQEGNCFLKNVK